MNEAEKQLVRPTFARIAPMADEAGAMLYENILAINPELRRLFKIDIETQGAKIMAVLAALAAAIAILVHHLDTSTAAGDHLRAAVARPSAYHVTSPRASTRADELAGVNHEGF
jgi:hemoglobin-like flavoprotein